jgi:hypothetical protein
VKRRILSPSSYLKGTKAKQCLEGFLPKCRGGVNRSPPFVTINLCGQEGKNA